jgi:hypothetical protein
VATRTVEGNGAGVDAVALGLLALALRMPAFLAARHLHPDDGTYGMSVVAMRHHGVPFRDVFSSQGPLHLLLLYAGDLLGFRSFDAPRVTPVLAGVAATVLAYLIVRRVATRSGALLAGVLVAASGSLLFTTGPITSDGPTIALVLGGFLAALRYADDPGPGRAAVVGGLLGAAMLVKPALAAVSAVAPAILVVRARRPRDLAAAAGTAVALALVLTVLLGASDVWDQAVRYQLDSEREQSVLENFRKVVTTLWSRDVMLLAAGATAVVAAASGRAVPAPAPPGALDRRTVARLVALWAALVALFLVLQPALWRNHLASLAAPLAVLVGLYAPPWRWVALVGLVVVPVHLSFLGAILAPAPYGGPTGAASDALRRLPPGALVLSDEVGLVWRSHRRTPADFVDASIKQLEQGRITTERIARAAARREVCGVLVWSARHWGSLDDLPGALAAAGYEPTDRFAGQRGARVLYTKRACDPG